MSLHRCTLVAMVAGLSVLLAVACANAATYYVAVAGDDANNGLSQETAWKTVTHAAARATAGDTVFIKAGLYRGEHVAVKNSGTDEEPFTFPGWYKRIISNPGGKKAHIVFQGYKNTPGDAPDPGYKPGDRLDPEELPVLDGEDGQGTGIELHERSCVEIRNLGLTGYTYGIFPQVSSRIAVEDVFAVGFYDKAGGTGGGNGLWLRDCSNCTIRNCVVADAAMCNIAVERTSNSVVENCRSYATVIDPKPAVTDYHIVVADGSDNVIRGCQAINLHSEHTDAHTGHGIGIKDQAGPKDYPHPHSSGNTIIDCVARDVGEYFFVAHEAHHNQFVNCTATGRFRVQNFWSQGINVRDGAHDNIFRECRTDGTRTSIALQDTVEGPRNPDSSPKDQVCSGNTFSNCVFADSDVAIEVFKADNSTFRNCVFDGVGSLLVRFVLERNNQGNVCRNTIVTNVKGGYQKADKGTPNEFLFAYSDFWQNGFATPAGVGNMSADPLFADAAKRDYHLKSKYGRWDEARSTWVRDEVMSPCIDAGDPADDFSAEPEPNGGRIDIGVHGGTARASKAAEAKVVAHEAPKADSPATPATAPVRKAPKADRPAKPTQARAPARDGGSATPYVVGAAVVLAIVAVAFVVARTRSSGRRPRRRTPRPDKL